jgi:hypothetical protein
MNTTQTLKVISFTPVNNDINGNPRYVCHFLSLLKENELYSTAGTYEVALNRAKKIGGRKFHNKQYGGGIAFSCRTIQQLSDQINKLLND